MNLTDRNFSNSSDTTYLPVENMRTFTIFGVATALCLVSLTLNILVLTVIFSGEKITKRVVGLLYLCIMLIYTVIAELTLWSIKLTDVTGSSPVDMNCLPMPITCSFLYASSLSTCSALLILTLDQYIYIERPFIHDKHMTRRKIIMSNLILTLLSHIITFIPYYLPMSMCPNFLTWYWIILILWAFVAGLCIVIVYIRMLMIAQRHRAKIQQVEKTHKYDSIIFMTGLVITFIIAFILPELIILSNALTDFSLLTPILLLPGIVFPLMYGSRFPRGFISSVKMAVCCCYPVDEMKDTAESLQVETAMRLAMMRLGRVMVRIDEQAALRRHESFLRKKKTFTQTFRRRRAMYGVDEEKEPTKRVRSLFAPWMRPNSLMFTPNEHTNLGKSFSEATTLNKSKERKHISWKPLPLGSPLELSTLNENPEEEAADDSNSSSSPATLNLIIPTTPASPQLSPLPQTARRHVGTCVLQADYEPRSLSPLPAVRGIPQKKDSMSEFENGSDSE